MAWDDEGLDDFLLPDQGDEEQEQRDRRTMALGHDLYMLTQLQPSWNVFCAWMRKRANDIARTALRGDGSDHSRDFWQGRLEECERVMTDLQQVIQGGRAIEAMQMELASKVRGEAG